MYGSGKGVNLWSSSQGCGVGVETGFGVGRSWPSYLESESEQEPVKFCRHRLRPVVEYHSTDDDFVRTILHRPEKNFHGYMSKVNAQNRRTDYESEFSSLYSRPQPPEILRIDAAE